MDQKYCPCEQGQYPQGLIILTVPDNTNGDLPKSDVLLVRVTSWVKALRTPVKYVIGGHTY